MVKRPPAIRRLLGLRRIQKERIVKLVSLVAAFTIGLVLGNRTGRQAQPFNCSANEPRVHVNGGFVQPYCNG